MNKLELRYLQGLISNRVLPSEFWVPMDVVPSEGARNIYTVLDDMRQRGTVMTPEVVVENLINAGMELLAAKEFVKSARKRNPAKAEVREIRDVMADRYAEERAKKELNMLAKNPRDGDLIETSLQVLRDLKAMQPSRSVNLSSQAGRAVEDAFDAAAHVIPWPLTHMKMAFQGLTRQEVSVLAGRPGNGKTTFGFWTAYEAAKAGSKVGYFSKEMPAQKLIQKALCREAGIDLVKFRDGSLTDEERASLLDASRAFLENVGERLKIFDDVYTVGEMESIIAKHRFDLVVDDFIQFTRMDERYARTEIKMIMGRYKEMAKEYNLHVMVLSQLNRSIETREDWRPRMSDLAESGSIEWYASDINFIFYEKVYSEQADPAKIEIICTKARYGIPRTVEVGFDGAHAHYYDARFQHDGEE